MRSATTVTFTVLVPTYQRVMDLKRCIDAIERQERLPDCVLIVCGTSDTATQTFLQSLDSPLPIEVKFVEEPGMIAALNVGLEHVTTDLVALTDDDAAPHPDWLARSERHFIADSGVGGVGGRDFVDGCFFVNEVAAGDVGRLQWFGRTIGNHHRGAGHPGTVDFLKGVNMAFRTEAIRSLRFDERLRGNGAQVHNELGFSLAIRRRGWKLVYDPRVAVDHFPATRRRRRACRSLDRRDRPIDVQRDAGHPRAFAGEADPDLLGLGRSGREARRTGPASVLSLPAVRPSHVGIVRGGHACTSRCLSRGGP
ncbi:MAG: glycosyltransferase family 2 protein [Candidatus Eremiobacteraeota bacterium]|nr:glycosyltransferase family 2 protein [Candidatus Eremiobacteraeota bacterium]